MAKNDHHVVPTKTYVEVFASLLVLTALTVSVSHFNFGFMNTVIAMLIATIKASLVLMFFMHLKYDDKINRVIFGTGFFFLIVLFVFSITDILTRYGQTPH